MLKIIVYPFSIGSVLSSVISPTPAACRFQPTCSSYMIEALQTHGLFYGGFLGIKRILSCHPWEKQVMIPFLKSKHQTLTFYTLKLNFKSLFLRSINKFNTK
jgi:putative membrane protein insertion efficiency factor